MRIVFIILEILTGVLLMTTILMQNSKGGLGSAFGGGSEFRSKRGAEILVFRATVVLAAVFLIVSVLSLIAR